MRNLKVLGLAFAATFAMSALVATAAQAGIFTTTEFPAIVTGEQEGGVSENYFEVPDGSGIKIVWSGPPVPWHTGDPLGNLANNPC